MKTREQRQFSAVGCAGRGMEARGGGRGRGEGGVERSGEEGEAGQGWVGWCFFQGLPDKVGGPLLVWASGEAAPGREGKEQAGAAPRDAGAEEGARGRARGPAGRRF